MLDPAALEPVETDLDHSWRTWRELFCALACANVIRAEATHGFPYSAEARVRLVDRGRNIHWRLWPAMSDPDTRIFSLEARHMACELTRDMLDRAGQSR